jgi:flavin reductase (DIM6/NTAB) family NADH-FMN oxidoreductase RutF
VGYHLNPDGLILLGGALAHIECQRYAEYPGGDHTIVVGKVVGGSTSKGRPLLYYRGGYAAIE